MNYTKIKIIFKDTTSLYITEEEVTIFLLSEDFYGINYLNDNDEYHRLDGPACQWLGGGKSWWVNGGRHKLDGPAVEWRDGSKAWCVDGLLHRLDGPAVEQGGGRKEWWIRGKNYTQEAFEKEIK